MHPAVRAESELEEQILSDPDWIEGARWGEPRPGHPEGSVAAHIREVLDNVDRVAVDAADRARLRLVALLHDTFKGSVDRTRPRSGENHHAVIARGFAERYVNDEEVLEVIELHDEAYNAWARGERSRKWGSAEARALRLIERLGPSLPFYLRFYRADTETGSKNRAPFEWFERFARAEGSGQPGRTI